MNYQSNYKTLRQIGQGGMSTVYLARSISGGELVAVKVLKGVEDQDHQYIKRFFREARITAGLKHPNIINIIESNFSPQERIFYIVSEYIEGGSFDNLIRQHNVSLKQKLLVLHKVLLGLDYAHRNGIIHRDIKPSNILLTKKQEPKLCDFGIATALWGQESRFTRTNEVMGTMDYIAPEQKESSRNVDARADIYSIGVILYQLVAGKRPQGAFPSPAKIMPSIPPRLDALIMKCLQPIPASRYKNVRNLADELHQIAREMGKPQKQPLQELPTTPPTHLIQSSVPSSPATTPPTGSPSKSPQSSLHPEPESPKTVSPVPAPTSKTVPGTLHTIYSTEGALDFETIIQKLQTGTIAEKITIKPRFLEIVDKSDEERLLETLSQVDGFLKETIIEALGRIKSKKSCSQLIELLKEPYYNKVSAAAIGEIGCAEAEEKLFNILLSRKENSHIALIPLGKINSVKSIDLISEYLTHTHAWVRDMALDALALIDDPLGEANQKIIHYLENTSIRDTDVNIRAKTKKILWRLKK